VIWYRLDGRAPCGERQSQQPGGKPASLLAAVQDVPDVRPAHGSGANRQREVLERARTPQRAVRRRRRRRLATATSKLSILSD